MILSGFGGGSGKQNYQSKSIFRANECDEHNGEQLYITYASAMMEKILGDTTLTSADFMAGR